MKSSHRLGPPQPVPHYWHYDDENVNHVLWRNHAGYWGWGCDGQRGTLIAANSSSFLDEEIERQHFVENLDSLENCQGCFN